MKNMKLRRNQPYVEERRKDLILLPRNVLMRMSHLDWNTSKLRLKNKKISVINKNQFLLKVNLSDLIF
jgi:hypothetical protein